MNYITISVGLVADHEAEGIDGAIGQGLEALSNEIGGPVELVSVVPVPIGEKLCVTVMAKPYQPPVPLLQSKAGMLGELRALKSFGCETTPGFAVPSDRMKGLLGG